MFFQMDSAFVLMAFMIIYRIIVIALNVIINVKLAVIAMSVKLVKVYIETS
jgi:hypothetical protein